MKLDVARLIGANDDSSQAAGITITTALEPLAGPFAPVKPAVYAPARQGEPPRFQHDKRWRDDGSGPRSVGAIVIDNVPSQANRLEAALKDLSSTLGLPSLVLDLSGLGELPPHIPKQLSSFEFPHRQADAYLRDALLDGEPFGKTDIGRAIFAATADDPLPLLQWFPQALLFGFWQSHLGKKGSQAKLARSWVSEIAGYEPASTDTGQLGLKGDPLNLPNEFVIEFDPDDPRDWSAAEGQREKSKAAKGKKSDALSNVGHGQVPVSDPPPAAVSFASIKQRSTVSFAALRRVKLPAEGRALLVALGIAAHLGAFGRGFSLRSGCELRPSSAEGMWLGEAGDAAFDLPHFAEAQDLARDAISAAGELGLPVGTAWQSKPLVLQPNPSLTKVITASFPPLD